MEEALRGIEQTAVYYDRRGLITSAQPARLDYRRIGLDRTTGYFHPKNVLLLLENRDGDAKWDSLLILTTSANLTQSGWWENVEVADCEEVHEGGKCAFRRDLLDLVARIKQESQTGEEHAALEVIRWFVANRTEDSYKQIKQGRWLPRLYVGQGSVRDFLAGFIAAGDFNLEIISPFFDDSDTANTLKDLVDVIQPKETRIFLPKDKRGAALCRSKFFEAVQTLPHVKWATLPDAIMRASTDKNDAGRFVHAKVYRFWNQQRAIYFIGSVNLTGAAHSTGRAGNFETGMLVEPEPEPRAIWWLESREERPVEFKSTAFEETDVDAFVPRVTFWYNWETSRLEYFWEPTEDQPPHRADISAQGVPKFSIDPIACQRRVTLPEAQAHLIRDVLQSTSYLDVAVDDKSPATVLVCEEGMEHKPSIFLALSVEEILQYWSLLSPEQREILLATKLQEVDDRVRSALDRPVAGVPRFDV